MGLRHGAAENAVWIPFCLADVVRMIWSLKLQTSGESVEFWESNCNTATDRVKVKAMNPQLNVAEWCCSKQTNIILYAYMMGGKNKGVSFSSEWIGWPPATVFSVSDERKRNLNLVNKAVQYTSFIMRHGDWPQCRQTDSVRPLTIMNL